MIEAEGMIRPSARESGAFGTGENVAPSSSGTVSTVESAGCGSGIANTAAPTGDADGSFPCAAAFAHFGLRGGAAACRVCTGGRDAVTSAGAAVVGIHCVPESITGANGTGADDMEDSSDSATASGAIIGALAGGRTADRASAGTSPVRLIVGTAIGGAAAVGTAV
jgi:hypothetical protein